MRDSLIRFLLPDIPVVPTLLPVQPILLMPCLVDRPIKSLPQLPLRLLHSSLEEFDISSHDSRPGSSGLPNRLNAVVADALTEQHMPVLRRFFK